MKKVISLFILALLYATPSDVLSMAVDVDVEYPQEVVYEDDSVTLDIAPQVVESQNISIADETVDQTQPDASGFCSLIIPDEDY